MDGLEELLDIVVIGATNRPDMLDSALLRPGRFDRIIFTDVPDKESRLAIFKIHTKNMPLAKDVSLPLLAEKTEGYSGADVEYVVKEAGMLTLRQDLNAKEVKKKYFDMALKSTGPSVTPETVKRYKDIEQNYLRSARSAIKDKENHKYAG
jgi:transitional endoplasmic reticulum ATPase